MSVPPGATSGKKTCLIHGLQGYERSWEVYSIKLKCAYTCTSIVVYVSPSAERKKRTGVLFSDAKG
jgi:hypothetical protein